LTPLRLLYYYDRMTLRIEVRYLLSLILATLLSFGCQVQPAPKQSSQSASVVSAPVSPSTKRHATGSAFPSFVTSFPAKARSQPATGRVLLFLGRPGEGEPRSGGSFFKPFPVYAIDVTNVAPNQEVTFTTKNFRDPDALAFPGPLDESPEGKYEAQVLWDLDNTERSYNEGPGNLYSEPVHCQITSATSGHLKAIRLEADQVVSNAPPTDTDWVKLVELRSSLLSAFHRREIFLRAAVILPAAYFTNQADRFPVVYVVPGFGGRHTSAWKWIDSEAGIKWKQGEVPLPTLRVVLDPSVPLGHSVFANSANNGPVGDALVQELIPEIEKRFRASGTPAARVVTGHSSGGWSSLWLQVAYPDFFGGCWSTSPDPVDFRAFQTMDIYQDRNGHWTPQGYPRPVARSRTEVTQNFAAADQLEYVIGYGSQLDSFDAVFGPRGQDGRPKRLIHKLYGTIDPAVAEAWKKYDIRLQLEENWTSLGPKLTGKIHVLVGAWDTFYLNPAVELLREFLQTTDYRGYVEILPGNHKDAITKAVRERIDKEIAAQFRSVLKAGLK
jgi:hypothetical protein